jgi:hypothetical protein
MEQKKKEKATLNLTNFYTALTGQFTVIWVMLLKIGGVMIHR